MNKIKRSRPDIAGLADKIMPILKRRGIEKAGLFGSFVRGERGDKSDIDILVDYPAGATLLGAAALKLELEEVLGIEVDLVSRKYLHPALKERVLNEEIAIL